MAVRHPDVSPCTGPPPSVVTLTRADVVPQGPYIPELTEAAQRKEVNYTGFVFDFSKGVVSRALTSPPCNRCPAQSCPSAKRVGWPAEAIACDMIRLCGLLHPRKSPPEQPRPDRRIAVMTELAVTCA